MSRTKVYKVWANIIQGKNHVKRWETFDKFHEDVGDPPTEDGFVFARLDSKKKHGPSNFEWRTKKEHADAESDRRTRKVDGKTYQEWAEETGIPIETLKKRVRRGWKPERLSADVQKKKVKE